MLRIYSVYGSITVTWPANVIDITPPYEHIHLEESFNAGMLAIRTVGAPIIQGAAVMGVQGIGVRTPLAADVADATAGLAIDMHITKPGIFTYGL